MIDMYVDGRYYLGRAMAYLEPVWAQEFLCPSDDEDTDEETEEESVKKRQPMNGWRIVYSHVEKDRRYVSYKMAMIEDGEETERRSYSMMSEGTFDYSPEARGAKHPEVESIFILPATDVSDELDALIRSLAGYTGNFHKTGVPSLDDLKELWPEIVNRDITKIIVNMDNMDEYLIK
jgi:hypothetical protein